MLTRYPIMLIALGLVVLLGTSAGCHSSQTSAQQTASPQAGSTQPASGQDTMSPSDLAARNARMQQERQSGND